MAKQKAGNKDHTFSMQGIRKEWKRIQWPRFNKDRAQQKSIVSNSVSVIVFTALFAVFFAAVDALFAFLIKTI